MITGTATQAGTFNFTVTATDSTTGTPFTGSRAYTLVVNPPKITVGTATLPNAQVGANYSQTLTAVGGTAPYVNFTVISGTLPSGIPRCVT